MIELTDKDFVVSFWVADEPDFLACVWHARGDPDRTWRLMYRLLYHADDHVFVSDERRWWSGCLREATAEEVHRLMEIVVDQLPFTNWRELAINAFLTEDVIERLLADKNMRIRMTTRKP